jgi:hypothetical protein
VKWTVLAVALLVALGLLISGCGESDGGDGNGGGPTKRRAADRQCGRVDSTDRCKFEIRLYCEYGAVSRAQLDSCERRVRWGEFKYSNTNAARFAKGELEKCLADAGPFCHASAAEPDYDRYYGE